MPSLRIWMAASGLLVLSASGICRAEAPGAAKVVAQSPYHLPLKREEFVYAEVSAEVVGINYDQRLLTLKTHDGSLKAIAVSDEVKRFNEVMIGDMVAVKYATSMVIEAREPTAEERANPGMVVERSGTADADSDPARGELRIIRGIVTVQTVDRSTNEVTIKGPTGNSVTVKAGDPKNLNRLKVGDTVAVSYTEATVVSLEPAGDAQ
jgi:hypothetical protein